MRSYLIAASPRVGGTWLCAELTASGLGAPGEHLNWLVGSRRWNRGDLERFWDTRRANLIYGVKVHLDENIARLDLDLILPRSRRAFIRLTRDDRDAQARSLAIARTYGCWFTARPDDPIISHEDLADARADIDEMNDRWDKWFAQLGIDPLTVTYEEMCADMVGVVERIREAVYAA